MATSQQNSALVTRRAFLGAATGAALWASLPAPAIADTTGAAIPWIEASPQANGGVILRGVVSIDGAGPLRATFEVHRTGPGGEMRTRQQRDIDPRNADPIVIGEMGLQLGPGSEVMARISIEKDGEVIAETEMRLGGGAAGEGGAIDL